MESIQQSLSQPYINLGQLLKQHDIISSGGMAKWYLQTYPVYVNGQLENRRGRKLYVDDLIELPEEDLKILLTNHETE
ncbi:S4 domain-containing protein YaaA [Ignavigranum ruoffiae]|uniref:S4 domain protein YaaA n=1 Tax=Ignavigranum ruoffiae TaxID=89093 RepID=A0A1H9C1F1_9LACT|nr:S4 domain-containing protein YaaA [Ignavigranum ruoffiae]UPQ86378.1 S4 domain-containing protein YaaA [Ignavigranum ruoffiae]SEP94468.1 S4 domain protein YaaA [Ignavigranum ruoffiae]